MERSTLSKIRDYKLKFQLKFINLKIHPNEKYSVKISKIHNCLFPLSSFLTVQKIIWQMSFLVLKTQLQKKIQQHKYENKDFLT